MNVFEKVVSVSTCAFVGGAVGATVLTGVGLVVAGAPFAATGFGIGAVGGTATGAMAGKKISRKVRDN